MSKLEEKGRG